MLRTRYGWVEPRFAEATPWHGLRRFRLRGLVNVNIEALLVATGQKLKRCSQQQAGALGGTGHGSTVTVG